MLICSGNRTAFAFVDEEIKAQKKSDRPLVVFVSGIDASGKTRFANGLAEFLRGIGSPVQVVHGDDFHRPKSYRYTGGTDAADRYYTRSFDTELLSRTLLAPIRQHAALDLTMMLLDLSTDSFTAERAYLVEPKSIVIVEGVFLARPGLRELCDLFIQIEVPLHVAYERANVRDVPKQGIEVLDKYVSKYFPAQIRYARACRPIRSADFVIANEDVENPRVYSSAEYVHEFGDPSEIEPMTGIEAVCFDLWETLVPLPPQIKKLAFRETANVLGMDADTLHPAWALWRERRETGELREFLDAFCSEYGLGASDAVKADLMLRRRRIHGRALMAPRPDAELTLRMLGAAGFRLGLLSNCTSDVPQMLKEGPLDGLFVAEVFSCFEGILKPQREIFLRLSRALHVPSDRCLYVGDGTDDELSGAASAGMTPVMLDPVRTKNWTGLRIANVSDLLYALAV